MTTAPMIRSVIRLTVGLLLVVKVLAIVLFIMLTSPTSTHALMRAGYEDGLKPVLKRVGNKGKEARK